MKHLVGPPNVGDAFLKEIWLQHLPTVVKQTLCVSSKVVGVANLASMADRILEVASGTISHVQMISDTLSSTQNRP